MNILLQRVPGGVSTNEMFIHEKNIKMARMAKMRLRGNNCFDFDYFRDNLPIDSKGLRKNALWDLFVEQDQFSGRPFR